LFKVNGVQNNIGFHFMDNRLTSSCVPQEKVSHAFMTLGWVKKGSLLCVWTNLFFAKLAAHMMQLI